MKKSIEERLKNRRALPWRADYIVHRRLWENLEGAISFVRSNVLESSPTVLDVGCGEAPYRNLFLGEVYLGMNYDTNAASPDFCGDALALPVKNNAIDIVLASQVLEHVKRPHQMLSEIFRVLKPGGYVVISAPFYWPIHEAPEDYFRFTRYGLNQLAIDANFEVVSITPDGSDMDRLVTSVVMILPGKVLAPLRLLLNIVAQLFQKSKDPMLPMNYTMIAKKLELEDL